MLYIPPSHCYPKNANYSVQTFGFIALLWLLFQVALGGGSVWFNGAAFGGGAKAKSVWKYHRLGPLSCFWSTPIDDHLSIQTLRIPSLSLIIAHCTSWRQLVRLGRCFH